MWLERYEYPLFNLLIKFMEFWPYFLCLINESIRRLNRENFYYLNQGFQIWWLISSIEAVKNTKFQLNIL